MMTMVDDSYLDRQPAPVNTKRQRWDFTSGGSKVVESPYAKADAIAKIVHAKCTLESQTHSGSVSIPSSVFMASVAYPPEPRS